MSETYYITGVQLGVLSSNTIEFKDKESLLNEIIDCQFLGTSKEIRKKLKKIQEMEI